MRSPMKGSHKKSGYFTVRLTVRGGGSAPSALTVSKCENFDPFFAHTKKTKGGGVNPYGQPARKRTFFY